MSFWHVHFVTTSPSCHRTSVLVELELAFTLHPPNKPTKQREPEPQQHRERSWYPDLKCSVFSSVLFVLRETISPSFHVYHEARRCKCPPGETLGKCVSLSTLERFIASPLSLWCVTGIFFKLRFWVCWFFSSAHFSHFNIPDGRVARQWGALKQNRTKTITKVER